MTDKARVRDRGTAPPLDLRVGRESLERAFQRVMTYIRSGTTASGQVASLSQLRAGLDIGIPDAGRPGPEVIDTLADTAERGLVGNRYPNFFGWVMGASHPVGVAADWLTSVWGQNSAIYPTSPAAAVAEEVVAGWLIDLFRLPMESSVGFTTGATMASFIGLAAGRSEVLNARGWDMEAEGLIGAPPVWVFVGEEAHSTIFSALRYLGFGKRNLVMIKADENGAMIASDLKAQLAIHEGAKIIVSQAGHINSGAFDPFHEIADLAAEHGAWHHVDGAFGLWARCVPELHYLADGLERADSWSVDGHKWLQVPYDSGFAIVRNVEAHKRAMDVSASYLTTTEADGRNPSLYVPELSKRSRSFAVWAVIQALGREGIAEMVRHHCQCAVDLAEQLEPVPGIQLMNDVTLNQLAIFFGDPDEPDGTPTDRVIEKIRAEGASYVAGAEWAGRRIMRVSVISLHTGTNDIRRLGDSIIAAWQAVQAEDAAD